MMRTPLLDHVVLGIPAPQGSKRAFASNGGHVRVVESSKRVGPWREAIVAQVRDLHASALAGPIYVGVEFYLPRPKSHYKTSGVLRLLVPKFCSKRPDIDKLLRSTLDGLKSAGVYQDDSQVVVVVCEKRYVCAEFPTPGARLVVEPIEEHATTNREIA